MESLSLMLADPEITKWAEKYPAREKEKEIKLMPVAASAGARGYLTLEEFLAIASWKSPRPHRFHAANTTAMVEDVTRRAFASRDDVEPILLLTALGGVQVRTATAILHLCRLERYPILDVWSMAAFGYRRDVTAKWNELDWLRIWPEYVTTCRSIASRIHLDLRTVDRALWAFGKATESRWNEPVSRLARPDGRSGT